jgi:hypothetical protein
VIRERKQGRPLAGNGPKSRRKKKKEEDERVEEEEKRNFTYIFFSNFGNQGYILEKLLFYGIYCIYCSINMLLTMA